MKSFFVCSLISLVAASFSLGQSVELPLNYDSAFRQALLKSVHYPAVNNQSRRATQVYIDFVITTEGKVSNVKILNEEGLLAPFAEEANRLMEQLPTQKSVHAGAYVLPVVFESKERPEHNLWAKAGRAARHHTFVQFLHEKSLLDELYVTADN
jgi:hypothetical protein